MQKFIITNGRRYVSETFTHHSKTLTVPSLALEMPYEQARRILLEHKGLEGFHMEGVEDKIIITKEDLEKTTGVMAEISVDDKSVSYILNCIGELADNLSCIKIPNKQDLMQKRSTLMSSKQYYDLVLTDIVHWSQFHNPPAHIGTQINSKLHNFRVIRANINEKIEYIDVLLKFHDGKNDFNSIVKELNAVKKTKYVPRTKVYTELDALLKPKKATM